MARVADHIDRGRLARICAGFLWLFLTAMYAAFLGVLALPGLLPALALFVRGRSDRVLIASIAAGSAAVVLGIWVHVTAIPADPVGLAGFVIIPIAATTYTAIAWQAIRR